jgi:VWFA-related protein
LRNAFLSGLLSLVLLAPGDLVTVADSPEPGDERPDSGLLEEARRTLVQLDVTVHGPPDIVATLTSDDFELYLGGDEVRDFTVDRLCGPMPETPARERPDLVAQAEPPPSRGVSFLFYFDQHHLTFTGRARSLQIARELIDELIRDGSKATIVSSGKQVRTFAPLTAERSVLLEAIDALEHDAEQQDEFPMQEDRRVEEVLRAFESYIEGARLATSAAQTRQKATGGTRRGLDAPTSVAGPDAQVEAGLAGGEVSAALDAARHVARDYQKEEWWRTDRALSQFSIVLGRMTSFDFPKAVIYFADRMRANAGEHYLGVIGASDELAPGGRDGLTADSLTGSRGSTISTTVPAFDWVVEEAAAHGVRLYTILAEGLVVRTPQTRLTSVTTERYGTASPTAMNRRFLDAESSLASFAAETGGQAFLRGVSAAKIAESVRDDMDCLYLVSFDPTDFPVDRPLPVLVRVDRPKVEARARGLLTIRSDSARLKARLTAAFAAPSEARGAGRLVGVMIPTGFEDGRYSALVQAVIPGSPQPQVDWDVGVSIVSRSRVREDASGRISVRGAHVPVVFETVVRLSPGPWELTGVAHDTVTGDIVAGRIEGDWPDPNESEATVGPIALLQPVQAVFLRDGSTRREGSLGRAADEPVRTDLPTALVGLVCRDRAQSRPLQVERRLAGEDFVDFAPLDLPAGRDRCAVVTDVIPADTMTAGMFRYEVNVRSEDEDVASGLRQLAAVEPDR